MATIQATDREGNTRELTAYEGSTLMEVLRDEGTGVEAICGGQCACATCHCFIDAAWIGRLSPAEGDELDLLQTSENYNPETSRLACQVPVTEELDGLQVTVAPEE